MGDLDGSACESCGRAAVPAEPSCGACGGEVAPRAFTPEGTVMSVTRVRVPADGGPGPCALVVVQLAAGAQLMASAPEARFDDLAPGRRVRVVLSPIGLQVEPSA